MNLGALYSFNSEDKILVDANVLIYVYCPLNSDKYDDFISQYTEIINKISMAKANVFVNSLIVSEFINRWLRLDFNKSVYTDFKREYRASARYKETMKSILRELKKFYTQCNVQNLDDNFNTIDFQNKYIENLESDFNDIIIAENALFNECKLLTQDKDFIEYGVTLV